MQAVTSTPPVVLQASPGASFSHSVPVFLILILILIPVLIIVICDYFVVAVLFLHFRPIH